MTQKEECLKELDVMTGRFKIFKGKILDYLKYRQDKEKCSHQLEEIADIMKLECLTYLSKNILVISEEFFMYLEYINRIYEEAISIIKKLDETEKSC